MNLKREQLHQRLTEAWKHSKNTPEWKNGITLVVDEILRPRQVGRPFKNLPSKIHAQIYTSLQNCIEEVVLSELDPDDDDDAMIKLLRGDESKQIKDNRLDEWARKALNNAYRKVLSDDVIDDLVLSVQAAEFQEQRGFALRELYLALHLSGRITYPGTGSLSSLDYEQVCAEALAQTWKYFVRGKVDEYNPRTARFTHWFKFILKKRYLDAFQEFVKPEPSKPLQPEPRIPAPVPKALLAYNCILAQIKEDQEGRYKRAHMQGRPDVNFQCVALERLQDKTWKQIASTFNVQERGVANFFDTCFERFRNDFQDCFELL